MPVRSRQQLVRMSGSLRSAARQAHQALLRTGAGRSLQQQRFAGNLPVKGNKHVEDWNTRREHIENEFKWDGKTFTRLGLFVVVAPVLIYSMTTSEFHHADAKFGRKEKQFMAD